jgi:hypothetical protein
MSEYHEAEVWSAEFSQQRTVAYHREDTDRLTFIMGQPKSLVDVFCEPGQSKSLDPPSSFLFSTLRNFLEQGCMNVLESRSSLNSKAHQVLIDEREDDQSDDSSRRRNWDYSALSYLLRPPRGNMGISTAVDLQSLHQILSEKVLTSYQ